MRIPRRGFRHSLEAARVAGTRCNRSDKGIKDIIGPSGVPVSPESTVENVLSARLKALEDADTLLLPSRLLL